MPARPRRHWPDCGRAEAAWRRPRPSPDFAAFGSNRLPEAPRRSALLRFAAQFNSLFIYVLIASAAISAILGHAVDAAVILAVVVINALIGFIQEGRAEEALAAIHGMIDPRAAVLRGGTRLTIPADAIVPGDIVLVEAGDRVPADLRLIRARNLRIDEAALTGELVAVDKSVEPVVGGAALGDRSSMAFSGTFVAAGQGVGVAVATGAGTELGRISAMIGQVEMLATPLVRQMDAFARQLTLIILAVSAAAFVFAVLVRNYPVDDAFMTVIGLAVAAIPEGLPAIMTITLAIGVQRMAQAERDHPPSAGGRDPRLRLRDLFRQDRDADPERDDRAGCRRRRRRLRGHRNWLCADGRLPDDRRGRPDRSRESAAAHGTDQGGTPLQRCEPASDRIGLDGGW